MLLSFLCFLVGVYPYPRKASIANLYDSNPNPITEPMATGAIIDVWRNSSRARIDDICTSMTGVLTAAIASRMATDVWVYPPAFRAMPSYVPSLCCMRSIISPSMFVWK